MPRAARKKSSTGIYHMLLRGASKQSVFYDDEDKEEFLIRLKLVKEKDDFEFYAFCLMDDHVHLLIGEKEASVGKIMQRLLPSFVFWYNSKYERLGNLFQDRFKSEPIEDDSHLLSAVRYIHQNPLKAKMAVEASDYKWSSYSAYLNSEESIIDKSFVLSNFQDEEQYCQFMKSHEENTFLEPRESYKISDRRLLEEIKKKLKIENTNELLFLEKAEFKTKIKKIYEIKGSTPRQISRVTGIPFGKIRGILY